MKHFTVTILLFSLCGIFTKINSQTPDISSYILTSDRCIRGVFDEIRDSIVFFIEDTSLDRPRAQGYFVRTYGTPLSIVRNTYFKTGDRYLFLVTDERDEEGILNWVNSYSNNKGFLIMNDSVTYKNKRWQADDFLSAISDYKIEVGDLSAQISLGDLDNDQIKTFRDKSDFHSLLVDETIQLCGNFSSADVFGLNIPRPVISAAKMNVLYIGVPNPLNVCIHNQADQEVFLSINKGKIIKTADGYVAYVDRPGKTTISVYKDSTMQKPYGCFEYRTKTIPSPSAHLQGSQGGLISNEKLVSATKLDISFFNFDYEFEASIISFTVSIQKKDADPIILYSNGDKITAEMTEAFRNLEEGTKIYFGDIWSELGGQLRQLGTIVFRVGE